MAAPSDFDGDLGYELLGLIGEGLPIQAIEPLLSAESDYARECAAWIMVETTDSNLSYTNRMISLSRDPAFRVRYWCVDFFTRNWDHLSEEQREMACALKSDAHKVVRDYACKQLGQFE